MRRKNRLRACALGTILAAVVGAADRAVGYDVAIGGDVYTASADHCGPFGLSCESWFEVKPIHGGGSGIGGEASVGDGNTSSHGTMEAAAGAFVYKDTFYLHSEVHGAGTDEYRGAIAYATIGIDVTDRITPSLAAGNRPGHTFTYVQHFNIDGQIHGAAVGPDPVSFVASAGVDVIYNNRFAFSEREVETNAGQSAGPLPRGDVWWYVDAVPGVPYDLHIRIYVGADGNGVEDRGNYTATSNFQHTFRWGEVTDVFDVTAGEPIPAEDFHLYGAGGFDWAHPPSAVPEPAAIGLFGVAAASLLFRRRCAR
jgi:hypothetical protein